MTSVANRRSMMNLYSGSVCIRSHQVRFVLSEKGIVTQINNFDGNKIPEDLIALNPFATLPTLVDRELVLYDSRVIIEYIDERYPYPPLLVPVPSKASGGEGGDQKTEIPGGKTLPAGDSQPKAGVKDEQNTPKDTNDPNSEPNEDNSSNPNSDPPETKKTKAGK